MMNNHLLRLQDHLQSQGILITFSGRLTQGIIEELGAAVKKYLETEERPKTDIFSIFSIFIEQTQNIKNYYSQKEDHAEYDRISNSCIVTIGKIDLGHYICSGNLIENQDIPKLVEWIGYLLPLGKDDLKKLYKQKLIEEIKDNSKGAGIGLIEICRKSSQPLEYSIQRIDERFSFFTLKAVV